MEAKNRNINKIINKIISSMLCLCLIPAFLPGNTACAAEQQVQQSVTVSADSGYPDDVIDVSLSVTGEPAVGVVMPSDVVMVMDVSGSMSSDSRISRMQEAAKDFVNMLDYSVHQVGVVAYQTDTATYPLSTSPADINTYIDTLSAGGTTSTDLGIAEGVKALNAGRSNATKVLIVLTDGQADSTARMLQAAEAAKAQNIVIFTVALLSAGEDPSTSQANLNMEMVATSDGHHHIVLGSAGLKQAYDEISQEIGVANVYNVKITQDISSAFEYVPGSADNNIPKPTISGNTLTWTMAELRQETLTLSYQIRVKSGVVSGVYPHTQSGSVKYKTYEGKTKTVAIDTAAINVNNYAPEITAISQSDFDIAGGDTVVITGTNFQSEAIVWLDGSKVKNVVVNDSNTITFVMPSHEQGTVNVSVTNPTGESAAVPVRFMATPILTKLSPVSGPYEGNKTVTITSQYVMNGAVVTFDGVSAVVTSYGNAYVQCKSPFIGKSGTVDVTITNPDGTTATLPQAFTYDEAEPTPVFEVTEISKASQEVGQSKTLTIKGKNFQSGAGFEVTVGGVKAEVTSVGTAYAQIKTPDSLSAGIYDIVAVNGDGQTVTLTQAYTYTAVPIEKFEVTEISKASQEVGQSKTLTIKGKNFQSGAGFAVTVGGVSAEVTSVGAAYVQIKTSDSLPAGTYDIVVVNGDGQTVTLSQVYTYNAKSTTPGPVLTKASKSSVAVGKAVTVTVSGTNFSSPSIRLGDREIAPKAVGAGYVQFKTPTDIPEGTYDITVTNSDGQSATLANVITFK